MLCLRRFFAALLLAICSFHVVAQELTDRYLSIRDKLTDLKKSSELVTEQLSETLKDLKLSQADAQKWEQTSIQLSENLMSINEQLNKSYETIVQLKTILKILINILGAMILIKIVFIVLYKFGIHIPRIVDIIA